LNNESSHWRKPITPQEKEVLKKRYKSILKVSRGGIFSHNQRLRLLGIKKITDGEEEKKLWFDIRESARTSFLDLKLICDVASDSQLEDIFKPLSDEDLPLNKNGKRDPYGKYRRYHIDTFLGHLLFGKDFKLWKMDLAVQLVETGINYLRWHPDFNRKLFSRLFNDVLDTIGAHVDSNKSAFNH